MTVRSFASASRNGTQRGSPPNPAIKPSFGPEPADQIRDENPLTSIDVVFGSGIGSLLSIIARTV